MPVPVGVQISALPVAPPLTGTELVPVVTVGLITAITQAASAVATISTVSASNPFSVGQDAAFSGVAGMTQINSLHGIVSAIGGTPGAWTITVPINSSSFSAYTSGGELTTTVAATSGTLGASVRSAAEIAAGAVPTNFNPLPGNALRYGAIGNGTADDTAAITTALLVASQAGGPVAVLPAGYTFKITSYIQIPSNTVLHIFGTVQLTNRASGFFSNNATNISVRGFDRGTVTDSTVAANYVWNNNNINPGMMYAPAFHFRSSINAVVEGLIFSYVNWGVLISNATLTQTTNTIGYQLTQTTRPAQCAVRKCNFQFIEVGSMACFNGNNIVYEGNYVYRTGDGGIWMMTCFDSQIIDNIRISPITIPADVVTFGRNNAAHPTTWNDEQGIELEGAQRVTVARNVLRNFWGVGIDIKNNSNNVLVQGNQVAFCEQASIAVREGDAVKNACVKISIIGNTISEHGTLQYNIPASFPGAIRAGECFITEIIDNVIYAYQTTAGINCTGPGAYQASWYSGSPHEASLVIRGNVFDFKNTSFTNGSEVIGYTSNTLGAIIINGQYDSVQCDDNKITADLYLSTDARAPTQPAISLTYVTANSAFYPNICSIAGNMIDNGWYGGIIVNGQTGFAQSGLKVNDNAIGAIYGGSFIQLSATHYATVVGNQLSQFGHGGQAGIQINGTAGNLVNGCVVNDNVIGGGMASAGGIGTNSMTYGIGFNFCNNCTCIGNRVAIPATGNVQVTNCTGDIITIGTTGFPRAGAGSPNGVVTSNYFGEQYFDSTNLKWWAASGGQSTTWTQLTN
jgi:hypothetical protein